MSAKVALNFDGIIIITWMFIKLIFCSYVNKSSSLVTLTVSHKLMIIHLYSYTTVKKKKKTRLLICTHFISNKQAISRLLCRVSIYLFLLLYMFIVF